MSFEYIKVKIQAIEPRYKKTIWHIKDIVISIFINFQFVCIYICFLFPLSILQGG